MTEEPEWFEELIGLRDGETRQTTLEPFAIRHATDAQEEAIKSMAAQVGFENLRGFWAWTRSAGLDYYDLIKVASPE